MQVYPLYQLVLFNVLCISMEAKSKTLSVVIMYKCFNFCLKMAQSYGKNCYLCFGPLVGFRTITMNRHTRTCRKSALKGISVIVGSFPLFYYMQYVLCFILHTHFTQGHRTWWELVLTDVCTILPNQYWVLLLRRQCNSA